MPRIDNKEFYSLSIQKYGISAKGVNWHSKKSQNTRFEAILKMLPDNISNFSLADAGCGFGDLYNYMSKNKKRAKKYIGIDIHEDMCAIASKNTLSKILLADICKDELPEADFYVCSGALNILDEFETYLFISNCYASSKKAFIFNALFGEKKSRVYNYISPKQLRDIAKMTGAAAIRTKRGYLSGDITVALYKEETF